MVHALGMLAFVKIWDISSVIFGAGMVLALSLRAVLRIERSFEGEIALCASNAFLLTKSAYKHVLRMRS